MKVKELIKYLKQMDQDAIVVIDGNEIQSLECMDSQYDGNIPREIIMPSKCKYKTYLEAYNKFEQGVISYDALVDIMSKATYTTQVYHNKLCINTISLKDWIMNFDHKKQRITLEDYDNQDCKLKESHRNQVQEAYDECINPLVTTYSDVLTEVNFNYMISSYPRPYKSFYNSNEEAILHRVLIATRS